MFKINKKHLSIGLVGLAAYSFISALYYSYQAGCAGDLKGAAFGNPSLALQMESSAFSIMFFGLVAGAIAIILRTSGMAKRLTNSLGFVIIGFVLFWLLSSQLSSFGVQSCFKP